MAAHLDATRWIDVGIVLAAIGVLTLIFFFQDWLVRRPKLFGRIRTGFLLFSLLWQGWMVHAQPSVVNVLAFFNALITDFKWDYFLMDPLLFILWCSIAAALLFWGRGPFCGWLCPFGALQELTNKVARRLKVPQITVPWAVHERLWPLKYVIFLGPVRSLDLFPDTRRAAGRGRAVQDRDRPALHPRLAVCHLRAGAV